MKDDGMDNLIAGVAIGLIILVIGVMLIMRLG